MIQGRFVVTALFTAPVTALASTLARVPSPVLVTAIALGAGFAPRAALAELARPTPPSRLSGLAGLGLERTELRRPPVPRGADPHGESREVPRGGVLSPIMTERGVLFRFESRSARAVSVVGDFNDWDASAHPMRRARNDLWRTTIPLEPGDWPYLYVVDGEWVLDPDNPIVWAGDPEASALQVKRDSVALPKPPGVREGTARLAGTYERVNQVTLTGTLAYESAAELHPRLEFRGGYSFGRERWLYDISFAQPLVMSETFEVGASAYRTSASPDSARVGDTENTLAAFFIREDWRDYHEAEGVSAFAAVYVGPAVEIRALWKDEEHRSVSKTTDWSVFGGDKRMRVNRPVSEGELSSVAAVVHVDTRNDADHPTRGFLLSGRHEWAGGGLGGDFEFRKAELELRRYSKLSRGHFFDIRVTAGAIDGARRGGDSGAVLGYDAIPIQELFHLGGTGTMRATQFKSLVGDRMLLANAEIRVEIFSDFQAAVFADIGDAWTDGTGKLALNTDAGVGFQDADNSFRLNLAKKMNRGSDGGVFVSARIRRMF